MIQTTKTNLIYVISSDLDKISRKERKKLAKALKNPRNYGWFLPPSQTMLDLIQTLRLYEDISKSQEEFFLDQTQIEKFVTTSAREALNSKKYLAPLKMLSLLRNLEIETFNELLEKGSPFPFSVDHFLSDLLSSQKILRIFDIFPSSKDFYEFLKRIRIESGLKNNLEIIKTLFIFQAISQSLFDDSYFISNNNAFLESSSLNFSIDRDELKQKLREFIKETSFFLLSDVSEERIKSAISWTTLALFNSVLENKKDFRFLDKLFEIEKNKEKAYFLLIKMSLDGTHLNLKKHAEELLLRAFKKIRDLEDPVRIFLEIERRKNEIENVKRLFPIFHNLDKKANTTEFRKYILKSFPDYKSYMLRKKKRKI